MYVLPHDSAAIAQFMGPVLEQLAAAAHEPAGESGRGPRAVVVTADAESAIAIARWVASQSTNTFGAIAATGASRAARLIAAHPAPLVVGPADQLLEMVRRAALKLDDVRAVVIAWADLLVDAGAVSSLEALMGEMPKESARTIVAARSTADVEALIEQYARRPRRVGSVPGDAGEPLAVRYVVTSAATASRRARSGECRDLRAVGRFRARRARCTAHIGLRRRRHHSRRARGDGIRCTRDSVRSAVL